VANYAPLEAMTTDGRGRVAGGRVSPVDGSPFEVRARVVVNATGVWADDVRAFDEGTHPHSLRPAKGVHVTVPMARFPADIAAVIPVPKDRRSIFVVPWPEADLVYLGTTDTEYEGPLEDPRCTPEDVEYLLGAANASSSAALTPADVTGVWAGLRPLLAPDEDGKTSERTADLSRRHTVRTSANGVITVTGGKLTTYRKMAEDTVDEAVRRLGGKRRRCVTKHLALHGVPPGGRASSAVAPRGRDLSAHLSARYGSDAGAVLALADHRPELLDPVVEGLPYIGAEVVYAARHEMARTIDDVLARRTRAVLQDGRAAAAAADAVGALLAGELGLDPARAAADAQRFAAHTSDELAAAGIPERAPTPERR
jgi:glycerol-3-phosphate dehydrogenase